MENDIMSLYHQVEHGFANIKQQLEHVQLAQSQQGLRDLNSRMHRLWMSYIKYCRSLLRNSTVEPVEFWRKRLATFCTSPTHDPISILEAVYRETIACGHCIATRVPDDM